MDADRFGRSRSREDHPGVPERLADTLTPVSAFLRIRRGARRRSSWRASKRRARGAILLPRPGSTPRHRSARAEDPSHRSGRRARGGRRLLRRDPARGLVARGGRYADLPPSTAEGRFIGYDAVRLIERIPIATRATATSRTRPSASTTRSSPSTMSATGSRSSRTCGSTRAGLRRLALAPRAAADRRPRGSARRAGRENVHARSSASRPRIELHPRGLRGGGPPGKEAIAPARSSRSSSRSASASPSLRSLHVYRALRALNPSPYLFHLEDGDRAILGHRRDARPRARPDRLDPADRGTRRAARRRRRPAAGRGAASRREKLPST